MKYCQKCGTANADDARFCSKCGKEFDETVVLPNRDGYNSGQQRTYQSQSSHYDSMGFWEASKVCMKKWVAFSGRATRTEYWNFMLFYLLVFFCALVLLSMSWDRMVNTNDEFASIITAVLCFVIFILIIFLRIASISAAVRRLHDTGRSGWWWWISIIPIIGLIIIIILLCTPSDKYNNQYGPYVVN